MQHKIEYVITPTNPQAHLFHVRCTIREPDPSGQIIWLPAWIPGSYMIRDFAKNIVTLNASAAGNTISVNKLDKSTWQCAACDGPLIIEYTVYAWDLSVRTAHLDTTHGFFNGSSVFVAVKGQEHLPCTVDIRLPEGKDFQDWRVATTLASDAMGEFRAGQYYANNYDDLIDHPVEMGKFDVVSFSVGDIPHHIVLTGQYHADTDRLQRDVQTVCSKHVELFNGLPDIKQYMFLLYIVDNGYGGLEHRSSTALLCSRADLPLPGMKEPGDRYVTLLGLFSHEYFHTWNVKQIKPREFIPYDLTQETYTRQLWAYEGITSYYDDLGLVRSGVINQTTYLKLLGKTITRVLRGEGRLKQSINESSFDAWTKFYKQDENAPNAIVSYYAKGALFALCLDMKIRQLSEHKKSLDDVMQQLWQQHGKTQQGTTADTFSRVIEETCQLDLRDFMHQYLNGTEDLPLAELLASMGLSLKSRVAESMDDAGGTPPRPDATPLPFQLGLKLLPDSLGARVQLVLDNGCIQDAGIAAGDVIVAVNNLRTSSENLYDLLRPFKVGDKVTFHVFRRDELMTFIVQLTAACDDAYYIDVSDEPALHEKRNTWLNEKTG